MYSGQVQALGQDDQLSLILGSAADVGWAMLQARLSVQLMPGKCQDAC